jgi:transcriptional regulator with PAS, ATPase and Fis domain
MKNAGHDKPTQKAEDLTRGIISPPQIGNLFDLPINFFSLLDEIPIGVILLSLDRMTLFLNQSLKTLTGFNQKDAFGLPCCHLLRSNECVRNCPALKINVASGPVCIEGDIIDRDRQLIPVRITSAPVLGSGGELTGFIETIEDIRSLRNLNDKVGYAYGFDHIIGRSPKMEKIFQILPSIAQSDSSVLITGETGTGKDLLAETLHQASNRGKGPFVKINCGALPETLLESELFGHRKGAFTGAVKDKPGRFQLAHNGSLYLTEIGDLPLPLQVKLLTFLDDKIIFPLGSTEGFLADVRVIAATHRNLDQMVKSQQFRQDLLFRLNVIRLHLPPLRQRSGDIRLLLDHFLNDLSTILNRKAPRLSRQALQILLAYRYPGNVRELRNILEYALNISKPDRIDLDHLPAYLIETDLDDCVMETETVPAPVIDSTGNRYRIPPVTSRNWAEVEKQMIMDALVTSGGRRNKAAADLGWARSTLWRKMKRYKIDEQ